MHSIKAIMLSATTVVGMSGVAQAATITSAGDTALIGASFWGFEELSASGFVSTTISSPDSSATMAVGNPVTRYQSQGYAPNIGTGVASIRTSGGPTQALEFTFYSTISAFGLNLFANDGSNWDAIAFDATGLAMESVRWTQGSATRSKQFQGISRAGIARVFLTGGNGDDVIIDDFTYVLEPAVVVPLPAGLPLTLTALGGLAWLRRRRG